MPRKKKEESLKGPSGPKRRGGSPQGAKSPGTRPAAKGSKPKKAAAPKTARTPRKSASPKPRGKKPAPARPGSGWKPAKYGETQVVAFIRDPNCVFVYWEIAAQKIEQVQRELKGEYAKSRLVLRMFRGREGGQADLIYEIEVSPEDMNRYLPVHEPGREYFVEVARKTLSGRVVVLARSNPLNTPLTGFSPLVDRSWAPAPALEEYLREGLEVGPDGVPGEDFPGGISSAEAQRRRRSPGGVSSDPGRRN